MLLFQIYHRNNAVTIMSRPHGFRATVCETVRPMLSDRCSVCRSVCLSVCDFGVLWPNGWTDQNETWHGGGSAQATLC